MKFFTPDLYLRLNSQKEAAVEDAHREWETAIVDYKAHLERISSRLTPSTRRISESLCLHDASYLGLSLPHLPATDNSLAILSTRSDAKFVVLVYMLAEELLIQEVKQKWPYSKEQAHWLYDEFDVNEQGVQQHEVLLSNGREITIRFHEMQQIEHAVPAPSAVA